MLALLKKRQILMIGSIVLISILFGWYYRGLPTEVPDFSTITGDAARGSRVVYMGGCISCHTDSDNEGFSLAGGRELKTPFGTFVTPNITPDMNTGIGGWTLVDFWSALANGKSPTGRDYYPSFPYTSYTKMNLQDIADLKAYLDTVPSKTQLVKEHDVTFPFSIRLGLVLWKLLFFTPGQYLQDPTKADDWNRGRYLVNGPGHCGECHTRRNLLGGSSSQLLAGGAVGMSGDKVPSIRGDIDGSLSDWSIDDIRFALETGIKPDGDVFGGEMADVVEYGTSHLAVEDLLAIAKYLKSY